MASGLSIGRSKIVVVPHFKRLHELVAKERNLFEKAGLDVEYRMTVMDETANAPEFPRETGEELTEEKVPTMNAACNWGVCVSAGAHKGKLVNDVYFRTENSIWVKPGSKIKKASDLAGVDVGVGELSGSHFSGIQLLEAHLPREKVKVKFVGGPATRLRKLMSGELEVVNLITPHNYIAKQLGYREVLSGHYKTLLWAGNATTPTEVKAYVRAMKAAQTELDKSPKKYKHYWNDLLPPDLGEIADVSKFGAGEVLVRERYSESEYLRTYNWMKERGLTERMIDNDYAHLIVS